jgi:hypothetical protein
MMTRAKDVKSLLQGLNQEAFAIVDLQDEIRVDRLCHDLLRHFNQTLTQTSGFSPIQAGVLCQGADYFLREFLVADRRVNLFTINAERIRQFAGHWYIVRTAEPNLTELQAILAGTAAFYDFLARQDLFPAAVAAEIAIACEDVAYYQKRIDDFWAIEGDGYERWCRDCPLEPVPDIS